MKQVFYIFGITATGKTSTGQLLAEKLKAKFLKTDDIYHQLNLYIKEICPTFEKNLVWPEYESECSEEIKEKIVEKRIELYKKEIPKDFDRLVIEGTSCGRKNDRKIIKEIIGEHWRSLLHIDMSIDDWLQFLSGKTKISLEKLKENKEGWIAQKERFSEKTEIPSEFHYTLSHPSKIITEFNLYQRENFSDKKCELLQLPKDFEKASVLDLGTNSGWIGKYCLNHNAGKVVGVDFNWYYLEEARMNGLEVIYMNLNEMKIEEKFDYVLNLALIHYIKDQENFIKKISEITKKQLILEVPISKTNDDFEMLSNNRKCPSKAIVEMWLNKYFNHFELIGPSISPDVYTKRLIYKAHKE